MFTAIKAFIWGTPTFNSEGVRDMKATIQPVGEKFGLFAGGELVGTYARKRDAVRGATRREFHLI
jgi:hypothetical protein